jgi:type II secretory pathway pseudopilin PulG
VKYILDKQICRKAGNTIIEILVATAVVGVILTALAVSMSSSIQNSAEAQYREVATRYAQDAMETIRKDKTILSWSSFSDSSHNGTWCTPTGSSFTGLSTLATSTSEATVATRCSGYQPSTASNTYYRIVTMSNAGGSVKVVVKVFWNMGIPNKESSTSVQQTFFKSS